MTMRISGSIPAVLALGCWAAGVLAGDAAGGAGDEPRGESATCDEPVRMLIYGRIEDREKFGAYMRAIAESGLYEKHGGYYEALTPPLAVLEGEPPPERGVVIVNFPCLAAAEAFWSSDEYAAIRPLREGIAEFEVLVLPSPPVPDYIERR